MKMRKMIATIMVFIFVIGMFTIPTSAMSKSGGKYVKVKKATYQKYKKAYKTNKKYLNEIYALQDDIETREKQIEALKKQIADLQSKPDVSAELAQTKEELENQKSLNRWVWNNIYSMGISYDKKVWTIPAEFPEKYIIDGATYRVEFEPAPVEESEVNEE